MMAEAGNFCFIATQVYGDIEHPQVVTLRCFRDQVLRKSPSDKRIIWWYYLDGKNLAELVSRSKLAVKLIRLFLDRLVWLVSLLFTKVCIRT